MKHCEHSQWLSLCTQDNEITFFEFDRLRTLVDEIFNPDHQELSLLILIENTAKTLALREILSATKGWKTGRRRRHDEVHLHLNFFSTFHESSILFTKGDFPDRNARAQHDFNEKCHETIRRILSRVREDVFEACQSAIVDYLYFRLFYSFVDVFCFFSANFDEFSSIVRHLASWLDNDKSLTLSETTNSWVIMITKTLTSDFATENEVKNRFLSMLKDETTKDLSAWFFVLDVLCIFSLDDISNKARLRPLKECLMNASDQVQVRRMISRTLFLTRHFVAFFRLACDHFARTFKKLFDFIRVSWSWNSLSPDLNKHLFNFLSKVKSSYKLTKFAVSAIAFFFLLDSYSSNMHGKRNVLFIRCQI